MEREKFIIHGKDLDNERRELARDHIKQWAEDGLEPVKGEIEKSPELLRYIETINGYLNEELKAMDLEEVQIDPRSIHLFPEQSYDKAFPNAKAYSFYRDMEDAIYINADRKSRLQMFKSILHEAIHKAAYGSVHAVEETRSIYFNRSGYSSDGFNEEKHFRGVNEAVVDHLVREIFSKHEDELVKNFSITEEEQKGPVSYYENYMDILDIVMEKIAQKRGEDKEAVWKRFKKGEFTGEMMHLRDVEETFGKGALRILASLDSEDQNLSRSEIVERMKTYFESSDEAEKERIANELLIEREKLKYDKRQ